MMFYFRKNTIKFHIGQRQMSLRIKSKESVIIFTLFIVLSATFSFFLILFGPVFGHSLELNLSWISAFSEQFPSQTLYPRWLFDLNSGAGSPVFYFYGPAPFWITSIITSPFCKACQPDHVLAIGLSTLLISSGLSFYILLRAKCSVFTSAICAFFYVFLPYHFAVDLWFRQSLGELSSYIWMPLILLAIRHIEVSWRYILLGGMSYAALIYSHIPSALLFSPVMLLAAVLQESPAPRVLALSAMVAVGLGLAAAYLVPALSTQDFISASAWWDSPHYDPRNWLWLDGKSSPDFAYLVVKSLLPPSLLAMLFATLLTIKRPRPTYSIIFCVMSLVYCWYLMLGFSMVIWENIDVLRKVQFPWRVGIIVDLIFAYVLALWLERIKDNRISLIATLSALILFIGTFYIDNAKQMVWNVAAFKERQTLIEIRRNAESGIDAPEYKTIWRNLNYSHLSDDTDARILDGDAKITDVTNYKNYLTIHINSSSKAILKINRFFYPGWELIDKKSGTKFEIEPSDQDGLITAVLPSGNFTLALQRQPIKEERIGYIASYASLFVVLLMSVCNMFYRRA